MPKSPNHPLTQSQTEDMPTVARIRNRLVSLETDEVTISQAVWVFGVSTLRPSVVILTRLISS